MPVYEYVCLGCESRFERLQGLSEAEPDCPSCHSTRVRRQLSVFAAGTSDSSGFAPEARGGGCACGGACTCRG